MEKRIVLLLALVSLLVYTPCAAAQTSTAVQSAQKEEPSPIARASSDTQASTNVQRSATPQAQNNAQNQTKSQTPTKARTSGTTQTSPDTQASPAVPEDLKDQAPKVFIDCRGCDRDFFREEIPYVNYVRDRKDADVHVLITDQRTGSGGREYTFAFIGLKEFEGLDFTLVYASGPNDTRDETRKGQVDVLKRGLFPYLLNTPICELIDLDFRQKVQFKPTAVKDPWNFWVFSASLEGDFGGEKSRSSRSLDANISANRVTPELKIRLGLSGEFDRKEYEYDSDHIVSTQEEKNFAGLVVKSLNDHWSVGGYLEAHANTYNNLDLYFTLAPAVEFNFFPYSESTRRQLRMLYKVGYNRVRYIEETIYDKTEEKLLNQSLTTTLEIREPWGSASTSLEGSHYFHDFSKYRIQLRGYVSVRVFKGFSFDIRGRYERIHDQLSLPKAGATLDEILLRRKELETNYDYSFSVGLRFTFGSVYSNVVNPRFEGSRYRGWR